MIRRIRALAIVSIVPALLVSTLAVPASAYPGTGGTPDGSHPTMFQGSLGGTPVCVLERLGVRYVRPGWCSSAPDLQIREVPRGNGDLPPGHPPVVPGRDGATPGTLRSI